MSINDKLKQGFDHDSSSENDLNGQVKDYLNSAWANNKGSLNDGLFNEFGVTGTDENGDVLYLNDRMKKYFNGVTIAGGIQQWNGVSGEDTYPPIMNSNLALVNDDITTTSIKYKFTPNEAGRYDCVLLSDGADAPTTTQIRAGQDGSGTTLGAGFKRLNTPMTQNSNNIIFTGLSTGTSYDLYLTFEDDEPTPNESSVVYSQITGATLSEDTPDPPADTTPPEFVPDNGFSIWMENDPAETHIIVSTRINESGDIFGLCVPYNAGAPTPAQVINQDDYGSVTIASADNVTGIDGNEIVSLTFDGLTQDTLYDIWITARDTAGNVMLSSAKLNDVRTAETPSPEPDFENTHCQMDAFAPYPKITDNSDYIADDWTFSAWIKNPSSATTILSYGLPEVFDNGDGIVHGYNGCDLTTDDVYNNFLKIGFSNNGRVKVVCGGDGSDGGNYYSTNSIENLVSNYNPNEWNHWIVTFDMAGKSIEIYVNDEIVFNPSITASHFPDNINQDINKQVSLGLMVGFWEYNLQIGGTTYLPYCGFDYTGGCKVDEVCIWDTKLDSNNITKVYNNGVPFDLSSNNGDYNQSSNIKSYQSFDDPPQIAYVVEQVDGSIIEFGSQLYIEYPDDGRSTRVFGYYHPFNAISFFSMWIEDSPNNPISVYNRSNTRGASWISPSARQSNTFESGGTE